MTVFEADMHRYAGEISPYKRKLIKYFRAAQESRHWMTTLWYRYLFKRLKDKRGIDIYYKTRIGKGLYIGHPWCITINPNVVIGENCNISKGVTIGMENRGGRKGCPTIGNRVWIGVGAVVVGRIEVGDDVLIAPNAFVNRDIPSHSIAIGNPCVIKHRDNATEGYISNSV